MESLSYIDRTGVEVTTGSIVVDHDGETGEVLHREGPIPGSRATREARGTVYVALDGGEHRAYRADMLKVV